MAEDQDTRQRSVDDDAEEEEIPRRVMMLIIGAGILAMILYLTFGGGHSHLH